MLYLTLMVFGLLAAGIVLIIFAPQVWWIGMILIFFSISVVGTALGLATRNNKKKKK